MSLTSYALSSPTDCSAYSKAHSSTGTHFFANYTVLDRALCCFTISHRLSLSCYDTQLLTSVSFASLLVCHAHNCSQQTAKPTAVRLSTILTAL
eukprot:1498-Heterococcus_DN1.PRE.2